MSKFPVYLIEEDIGTYVHRLTTERDNFREKAERLAYVLNVVARQKTYFEYDGEDDPDEIDWANAMEEVVNIARDAVKGL